MARFAQPIGLLRAGDLLRSKLNHVFIILLSRGEVEWNGVKPWRVLQLWPNGERLTAHWSDGGLTQDLIDGHFTLLSRGDG